ncbi:unnamed protein product [Cryptosporidium hominis]|uniref:BT1 family protein n=1 Tax=Cryptosporidium hominis TaxID=237895 RepID=A0A0S4TIZ8_CRYHO|nr:unnamed protein product [Cryptosporidium hominis]
MDGMLHQNEIISLLDEKRTISSTIKFSSLLGSITITKLVIFLVGFSDGLTHLATLAIYYLLKDDLRLSPPEVSVIYAIPAIPWFLKPLFGMRRKPYLIFFSILQVIGFLLLATNADTVFKAAVCLLLISLSAAFCSSIAEVRY